MTDNYELNSRIVRRVSIIGGVVNLSLAIAKAIGGFVFHSHALLADAVDSTSDLFTDLVTITAVRFSHRPVDDNHPYGHGRFESLASLIISVVLFVAAGLLISNAIQHLTSSRPQPVGWPAAVIAAVSVVTKEILFRWTKVNAQKTHSPALLSNAYHHRSDAFSSITVVLGVTGSVLIESAWWLDSVASLAVSGFIVAMGVRIGLSAIHELTDMEQNRELVGELEVLAENVPDVVNAHRIRTRRYGSLIYVDLDIELPPAMTIEQGHAVAHTVKDVILAKYDYIADALIHIEPEGSRHEGEGVVRGAPEGGVPNGG
ncbi:cation diffusion facilitator family transporter [bacterium]|nr:cation diffusion facilitator family transporter [bacterium]